MNARKMSIEAISRDLGWEPRIAVREGVALLHEGLVAGSSEAPAHGELATPAGV